MRRFLHSVRLRLTLWYASVLAIVLAVFAVSVYVFVVRTAQTSIDQALQSFEQQTERAAAPQIHGKKLDVRKVHAPSVNGRQGIFGYVLISNLPGRATVVKKGHVQADTRTLQIALRTGKDSCTTLSSPYVGKRVKPVAPVEACFHVFKHKGRTVGGVEVVASLAGVYKALDRLRLAFLLGIPFVLLLSGAGGWLLAGRALEPVDRIGQMARSITASDLSRRINLTRHDELGRLASTFDDMFDRLEQAFQEQKQLTADVSHELRSPLTILEAQTSLALRRSRSPEEYRQVLLSVQEEVERMSTMVNQLLTLARAEAGEEEVQLSPLTLWSVAEPVVEGMQPVAADSGVRLKLYGDADVSVMGDAGRLRQLLLNLLDNAIRHTPSGGSVDVSIGSLGGRALLTVADTGEGIPPGDLPHIFQRFYRGDRARQRAMGNSGLGLSIVRWIVEAHGGSIDVRSEPGHGARFSVRLPLVEAAIRQTSAVS